MTHSPRLAAARGLRITLACNEAGRLEEMDRFGGLIQPSPDNVPVTGFDTEQTVLTRAALRAGRPAAVVMADSTRE